MSELGIIIHKCAVVHLVERNLKANYSLGTAVLGKSEMEKDLGILLYDRLTAINARLPLTRQAEHWHALEEGFVN